MLHRLARAFAVLAALAAAQASAQGAGPDTAAHFSLHAEQTGRSGAVSAVVILHHCSGRARSSGAPARWSAELVREGYVTHGRDSF